MTSSNDHFLRLQTLYNTMKMHKLELSPLKNSNETPIKVSTSGLEKFSNETKINDGPKEKMNENREKRSMSSPIDFEKLPSNTLQQYNLQAYQACLSGLTASNSYVNSCLPPSDYLSAFQRSIAPPMGGIPGLSCNMVSPADYWSSRTPQADVFSRLNPTCNTHPSFFYSSAWGLPQSNGIAKSEK